MVIVGKAREMLDGAFRSSSHVVIRDARTVRRVEVERTPRRSPPTLMARIASCMQAVVFAYHNGESES